MCYKLQKSSSAPRMFSQAFTDCEVWQLPEVEAGVSLLKSNPLRKDSRFFPKEPLFVPSCGVRKCTDAPCRADTLTPVGCLGRSIWSLDQDFPITFSDNTDGVFPIEWALPTILDMAVFVAALKETLRSSVPWQKKVLNRTEQWLCDESSDMLGGLFPSSLAPLRMKSHPISVLIKPLESYKLQFKDCGAGVNFKNLTLLAPPPSSARNRTTRAWWRQLGGQLAPDCTHHTPGALPPASSEPPAEEEPPSYSQVVVSGSIISEATSTPESTPLSETTVVPFDRYAMLFG